MNSRAQSFASAFWRQSLWRRFLWLFAAALSVGLIAILCWPGAPYEWNKVDALVRNAPRTYRSASVESFLDGGSIGIFIVDATGAELNLVLPVTHRAGQCSYERLARPVKKYSIKGMPLSIDTRNYLIRVMEQHRGTDGDGHLALLQLRGWPKDYLRFGGLLGRIALSRLGERIMRSGPG